MPSARLCLSLMPTAGMTGHLAKFAQTGVTGYDGFEFFSGIGCSLPGMCTDTKKLACPLPVSPDIQMRSILYRCGEFGLVDFLSPEQSLDL